jgi:nudix-type nucleoside diphosphatase (YffH/AdpP family)
MKIISQKEVYKGRLKIEEAVLEQDGKQFKRERIRRENAAAILVYVTDNDCFILTRQFRYAIIDRENEQILEIPAGKMDGDESPETCAIRETEEETGYRITRDKLVHIGNCFVSPGYSSEMFHLFFARVMAADKVSANTGLADEGEFIETKEMRKDKFIEMAERMEFRDCKTLLAALWFLRERKNLGL